MVGGEQQQVVVVERGEQLRQAGIEVLQRSGVARHVPAVAIDRIEIDEVGHDHGRAVAGFVGGARHFGQGGLHQRVVAAGFDLVGNAAVGVDVGDLANRHHFTAGLSQLLQHGGAGRLNAVVAAIAGAGKAFAVVADERAGDDAANVVRLQQFAYGFAQGVEALQAKMLFVGGNLEHGVCRGVDDRLAALDMLFTQAGNDLGARSVAVTDYAGQVCLLDDAVQQRLGKTIGFVTEVTPVEAHWHTGNFPVAGRGVFPAGDLFGVGVSAVQLLGQADAFRHAAGGIPVGVEQAERGHIGELQRTGALGGIGLAARAGGGDVAQGVSPLVTEFVGVRRATDSKRVEY